MKTQRQINRFVGKCKITQQMFFLVEYKGKDDLQWEHCIDVKNGETMKQMKEINELTKSEPLPYIHPDYKSYKELLIKKCYQKHEQRMALPQHSRKVQRIVGKARINNTLNILVKWKDYPDSEATWVNSSKMWNFFRASMKVFNEATKNHKLPFVYEGFEHQLSAIMNEEVNSESGSQNSKDSKRLIKENKMKKFNIGKREQVRIERKIRAQNVQQAEKYSDIIDEELLRQQDSLGEQQNIFSSKKVQSTKNFKEKTKLAFDSLVEKKVRQKGKFQICDLTSETKVQDISESFVMKVENQQTKNKPLNLQINGTLNRSQEMEIFQNTQNPTKRKVKKQQYKNSQQSERIQISLQCQDVPVGDSNEDVQNLYRVLIDSENQFYKEPNMKNIKKETKFLLTSQMLQSYPKQFTKYLETKIKQLSKLKN